MVDLPLIHGHKTEDFRLRPHVTRPSKINVDTISSLPDELLIRILSSVSTKDAAGMSVLSKRMRRLFPWLTNLYFNDSPISHCLTHPYQTERFLSFKMFVDVVLQKFTSPCLAKFELHFGGNFEKRCIGGCRFSNPCKEDCFPYMNPSHLNAWICFPLTRSGLREIELSIYLSNSCQLPPQLFTCETLQILKLDVNLDLGQVCAMSSYGLPNLKVFHLHAVLIPANNFLTRLASCCPLLEELDVWGYWEQAELISISSPSLRNLTLSVFRDDDISGDVVQIDAPNLRYLDYSDDLAHHYSISNMNSLVEAVMGIMYISDGTFENNFQAMNSLVKAAYNVQRLHLTRACVEALEYGNLKDQPAQFLNLKQLELGQSSNIQWDKVFLWLLHYSPYLETLIFPSGPCATSDAHDIEDDYTVRNSLSERDAAELERRVLRTRAIPQCCRSHLKRIEIGKFWGMEREMEVIKYFLRHGSVLETLVICNSQVDTMSLESTLRNLPTASTICSIEVR